MSLDDFIKGASVFTQGLQKMAVGEAMRDANAQIAEMNATMTDEKEKFAAMNALGQSLAQRMMQAGANPSEIEATAGKMRVSAGQQLQVQSAADLQKSGQEFKASESALERDLKRELATLKASQKKDDKQVRVSDSQLEKIQGINEGLTQMKSLENTFLDLSKKTNLPLVGPGSGGFMGSIGEWFREKANPEFSAFRKQLGQVQDKYRKLITGAQASEKEIEILKQHSLNEADTPQSFSKSLKTLQHVQENIKLRRLETLKKAGRDVEQFVTPEQRVLTSLLPGSQERIMVETALKFPNDPKAQKLLQRYGIGARD